MSKQQSSTKAGIGTGPENKNKLLTRRAVLTNSGAAGAVLASGLSYAAAGGHDHAKHVPQNPDALHAANHCSEQARACLAHCLASFQDGDTALADCARKVNEMSSLCDALASQLATNSNYVQGIAAVCRDACSDCEAECRRHEDSHVECRDCANSCATLIAAIDKM